ncbi:MAG: hypothetical protein RBR32_01715 [Bacteroidales bacterium]|nr:hypothetical protein [Bacteroidales bacterium]
MSRIIQCSCLGKFGRWANQLFQYCFARAYAETHDAVLEIPADWIGRKIFKNIDHPPIKFLKRKTELDIVPWGEVNIDLFGYFQFQDCFDILSMSKIKKWLQFKDEWIDMFPKLKPFYVAAHIRRGDYVSKYIDIYCCITQRSYIRAIEYYGFDIDNVIWVSDDNPYIAQDCKFDFLPDFFTLMNADILFRANSTFSLWASILGNPITYSPVINGKTGFQDVNFMPGNHYKILNSYKGASPQQPCEFIFRV